MPRSRLRWKYTEDDVAEAILDVTDNGFSPPQAAHKRGVPRRTLIDRLHGRGAVKEQIHPHRRLSKRQEDRLAFWILRQESLGYAPSHSQIRACVIGLLRQQGEHLDLGRNWVNKFINRRADLNTKMGRRQEAKRFNSFTPKAVHWYFDIRDGQYGWIKPENTVNVDEGGLDSLVVGSADPKRKAFLKGPQTRNWTSFIEAVTADGRALVPGIIFKGKELQKQWFLEEFKQIADWYYITSPNGWTDDHIGIEWLERVYLPQTTPADESDARLIILDGHGSHATPLDNGVFNASKAAYRRELAKFASLTDSAPIDKVNFIRAYAKARRVGMTKKNILSGWRVTGNWPISRDKALRHPEIQQDRPNGSPRVTPEPRPYLGSDDTPQTSRQIRDLGLNKTPKTRRRYNVIAKDFEAHQQTVAAHTLRIASLEEELARLKRGKKRKAVPNPNRRFMTLGETLAGKEPIPEGATRYTPVGVEFVSSSEQESESEAGSVIEKEGVLFFFYVDDVIIAYRKARKDKADELTRQLGSKYKLTGGDPVQWFLGMEVIRDRPARKIWLSQTTYIDKIANLANKGTSTVPMTQTGLAAPAEIQRYQRKVGSILYIAVNTRPDIAFAASRLARFLVNPGQEHQDAADRVIHYLSHTRHRALRFGGPGGLTVASDASFADNTLDRKSSQAYTIRLFDGLIGWRASKQNTVTTSTTEAELLALAQAAKESLYVSRLLKELTVQMDDPTIRIDCDNTQTINLVTAEIATLKTKLRHVDIHNHWLRQEVQGGRIQVKYTKSTDMIADGLTKALPAGKWNRFLYQLGLEDIQEKTAV
ncbi:Retrovirus-related Pol polyprotein from transposon TNT [Fusarium oxysporum f. sp. conglutinans]|nr:Retrovirus-related Pol polyprotein from transposon TNT [Fusarium oxysporum f. sp. conglutinans]